MKRHIIFVKNVQLANALLSTYRCTNESNWIFTCDDNKEDMQALQQACTEFLKGTSYSNYKLSFANPSDYGDLITINNDKKIECPVCGYMMDKKKG